MADSEPTDKKYLHWIMKGRIIRIIIEKLREEGHYLFPKTKEEKEVLNYIIMEINRLEYNVS